jgi:hypothetical protein
VISECGLGIHHRANEPDGELRVGRQKQRTFAGTKLHHGLQGEIVVVEIFRKRSQTELRRTPLRSQRELFPNSGAEKGHLKFTTFEKGSGVSEGGRNHVSRLQIGATGLMAANLDRHAAG